jgi:hypothetical protein
MTFNPDALRQEFADYCTEVEPDIKAKAPRLNQIETLALIGMTLFQAAKELKADRAQLADEVSGLRAARIAYASEFPPDAEGLPDVGNIHANIRAMKDHAARYDFLRQRAELRQYDMGYYWYIKTVDVPMGMPAMAATLANVIDCAIAADKEKTNE